MPFGGGTFTLTYSFSTEAAAPPIEIAKLDNQFSDIATGLSNCILRDGTGLPTSAIGWNGQRLTNLGTAAAGGDALSRDAADARYPQLGVTNTYTSKQVISSADVIVEFNETDAAANNRRSRLRINGEAIAWELVDDGITAATAFMTVNRTLNVVDSIDFSATFINLNGVASSDFARVSQNNTFTGATQTLSSTNPVLRWNETDAAANNRAWYMEAAGEQFAMGVNNDAVNSFQRWLVVDRTANTVDTVALTATTITLNGVDVSAYARLNTGGTFTQQMLFSGTGNGGSVVVTGTRGILGFFENDAAADNGRWRINADTEQLRFELLNDAASSSTAFMTVDRTANTTDSIALASTALTWNGSNMLTAGNLLTNILAVDGAGSGIDADLLDGQSSAFYQNAGNLNAGTIPSARVTAVDAAATISSVLIGFRTVPRRTSGFANNECLATAAGVTINTADLAAGSCYSIYNDSASSITITQGAGVTLRLAGTATTGSRTLAPRGMMTVWGNSGTEGICSGPGVT